MKMFYLTEDEREFFESLRDSWNMIRKHPVKALLGTVVGYIYLVVIIGVFG